jgi:dUTP pyrophosphatase
VIPSKGKATVKLDISVEIPKGCYGRIAPRSGLAVKHFIDVGAGVVDRDYRGNVAVVMFNFSDSEYRIRTGDRIAQLICEKIDDSTIIVETNLVTETERGVSGMGSTGY